jgi:hypothetical protein
MTRRILTRLERQDRVREQVQIEKEINSDATATRVDLLIDAKLAALPALGHATYDIGTTTITRNGLSTYWQYAATMVAMGTPAHSLTGASWATNTTENSIQGMTLEAGDYLAEINLLIENTASGQALDYHCALTDYNATAASTVSYYDSGTTFVHMIAGQYATEGVTIKVPITLASSTTLHFRAAYKSNLQSIAHVQGVSNQITFTKLE